MGRGQWRTINVPNTTGGLTTMQYRTIHKRAELVAYVDLPEDARGDFDYIDPDDHYTPRFVSIPYTDGESWIDTSDMMVPHRGLPTGWDAYQSDTFYSATLVKFLDDDEVKVGEVCV